MQLHNMLLGPKSRVAILELMKNKWYLKFVGFFKGTIVNQHIRVLVPKSPTPNILQMQPTNSFVNICKQTNNTNTFMNEEYITQEKSFGLNLKPNKTNIQCKFIIWKI